MKDFNEQIKTLKDMIEESHTIAFFTGAGISTLSGIPDFRSKNGLYSNRYHGKKPEKILHIKYFNKHPEEFYAFYREKLLIDNIDPNVIHLFISELQQLGKEVTVVTQNIDGLHEKAGSLKIHNLHGTIHRNYCVDCKKEYDIDYIKQTDGIPYCKECGGIIRPAITFYGEFLDKETFKQARLDTKNADLLIVLGTSLVVYPASEIVSHFRGKHLVIINKKRTKFNHQANLVIQEDFAKVFNALLKEL
ncbi:NAD-dependent protein deacylase [Erysipelotrichaceae bacterium]|jgi:NAD-dependent deacetylase|uniref:NAD-dependent protein deacylase n=1 Tax=unclassified Bulleidia TaxID=2704656 RepID=UPI0015B48670|nr:NAD-dependent protein deacylase [Erysipelotrichaceae bacterium]MDD7058655.1 NAD-dependent protein deacylase [Erysipelotrichaceae bacterium]MDY3660849.1 NAD-dependent protein deacylase [Bulleidia sp.]